MLSKSNSNAVHSVCPRSESARRKELQARDGCWWLMGPFPCRHRVCMARMVLEATGAPAVGWEVARRARQSQLMTYRSLFVVASGQNASDRPTSSAAPAGETTAERMIMGSCAKLARHATLLGREGGGTTSRHGDEQEGPQSGEG